MTEIENNKNIMNKNTTTCKGQKLVKKYQKLSSYHHFELLDDIYKINMLDDIKNIKSCNALIRRFNKSKKPELQIKLNSTLEEQQEYFKNFNIIYRPNYSKPYWVDSDDE